MPIREEAEKSPKKPSESKSKAYESFGSSPEDFNNYLILKRKFDEIHVFMARIAGMLSRSIQDCRRRHTSPEIKQHLNETGAASSDLKKWLINSPSKAQIDKDSKRFYMKFKKRFEASRPCSPDLSNNLVYDLVKNFTDFITEKCQVLLNEYDEFYCVLAETIEGVKSSRKLQQLFNDLFKELDCEELYDSLISGSDFEIIFRNILSSSLVKLAQLMTDLLDSRYSEIRLRKASIQKFVQSHLVIEEARESQLKVKPERQAPKGVNDYDSGESGGRVIFHTYNNHLYDSL